MTLTDNDAVIVDENNTITTSYWVWREILGELTSAALDEPERAEAKDAMSAMQTIIVVCRSSRKFQRDAIPLTKRIAVTFNGREWPFMKSIAAQFQAE